MRGTHKENDGEKNSTQFNGKRLSLSSLILTEGGKYESTKAKLLKQDLIVSLFTAEGPDIARSFQCDRFVVLFFVFIVRQSHTGTRARLSAVSVLLIGLLW